MQVGDPDQPRNPKNESGKEVTSYTVINFLSPRSDAWNPGLLQSVAYCSLCDSRSLLLAVLCLFWPYLGP